VNQLITIGIVDDHDLFRAILIKALSDSNRYSVMLEAKNGLDLLAKINEKTPDVILLDIRMPGIDGIETLEFLNKDFPQIRVIVLTAFYDELYVQRALEQGISGYLTKHADFEDVLKAIDSAAANKVYINDILSQSVLKSYARKFNFVNHSMLPEFSVEEVFILNQLKNESTTQEIAHKMSISQRSVEAKRDRMKKKASVKTIAGLLLYAVKRGLLSIDREFPLNAFSSAAESPNVARIRSLTQAAGKTKNF
jgi:DNA-binding NarL/FixJ family response regulator